MPKKPYSHAVQFKLTPKQQEIVQPIFNAIAEDNANCGQAGFSLGTIKNDGKTVKFVYVKQETARKIRGLLFPNKEFKD